MAYQSLLASPKTRLFRRIIAVPSEHGSWVFLFSPLLIGSVAGREWKSDSLLLVVLALAAFMLRQPVTILVKVMSRRRPKDDFPAALFWFLIYMVILAIAFAILAARGYGYLAYLAIPAVLTLGWHLWLVSRRSERRKPGIEIIASGTLALAAPAAYWIAGGKFDTAGWWLWGLCWLQAANSIVYAYLRLDQRVWKGTPVMRERLRAAWRPILYTTVSVAAVGLAGILGTLPKWLFLAFSVQWIEALWGAVHPAVGYKPTAIGIRQLIVSVVYTAVFILLW